MAPDRKKRTETDSSDSSASLQQIPGMSEGLPNHPVFLRLSESDRLLLLRAAEVWEAPTGGILYREGDRGEDLLLILRGRLEESREGNAAQRWFPGDLWGEERLWRPQPIQSRLISGEPSLWLRWSRDELISLARAHGSLRKALQPLKNGENHLLSGLPEALPAGPVKAKGTRRLRQSFRLAIPGMLLMIPAAVLLFLLGNSFQKLPDILPLAVPALYLVWLLVFSFKRLFREYGIEADALSARAFDWSKFIIESRHVPIDQVQGVEVQRNGLIRRILRIGTVIVKTSAVEGVLEIRDIKKPRNLAAEIQRFQKAGAVRSERGNRESLRRSLEESGLAPGVPRRIREPVPGNSGRKSAPGELRIRRSPVVLIGSLILPVLVSLVPILTAVLFSPVLPFPPALAAAAAVLPLFWAWYRFEDWRNDNFRISGGYAVDLYRKPLGLKESRRQVELASVQNIRTEQKGILSFLFRFGDVILVTTGGASDTVFKGVSRPWHVQEILFQNREEGLRRLEERHRNERRDEFVRFAEVLDQIRA